MEGQISPLISSASETSGSSAPQTKPSRRRDKPQLSCNLCRKRKLRCDRVQPCTNCTRRGLGPSCVYTTNGATRLHDPAQPSQSNKATLLDRISQLEGMVTGLMGKMTESESHDASPKSNGIPAAVSPPATHPAGRVLDQAAPLSDTFGRISLENAESSYVEKDHWTAILDEIADLKDCFEDEIEVSDQQTPSTDISDVVRQDLLFGSYAGINKQTLLLAVPERTVCDRLVTMYFASMELTPLIIHRPTFLKEYDKFWTNQTETPTTWLGLLFAILCVATMTKELQDRAVRTPEPTSEPQRLISFYREKIGQCLCLGEYMKGGVYTIETLVIYLFAEYGVSEDSRVEIWVLLGVIIRLALRLGYHRDGAHSARISVFQAEMRRRIWSIIYQFDILMGTQFGLPRMIREAQTDTTEPSNFLDEDLDENLLALPEPRPQTELTHVLFIVSKGRLVRIFGSIMDAVTSINLAPYAEIMALDKRLQDTWEAVPGPFHLRAMYEMSMDPPGLIFGRMILILIFYKSQVVLHRKYMLLARTDQRYMYSRDMCIGASLKILQLHATMVAETEQGGRLYEVRWRFSAIFKQEFLLATTVLCLEIDHNIRISQNPDPRQNPVDEITKARIITALSTAQQIWLKSSVTSQEAKKAAQAVRIVLSKLQGSRPRRPQTWMDVADEMVAAEQQTNSNGQMNGNGDSQTPIRTNTHPPRNSTNVPISEQDLTLSVNYGYLEQLHGQQQQQPPEQIPYADNGILFGSSFYGVASGKDVEMNDWSTDYQNLSLDEFLDMPEWAGFSQFPVGSNGLDPSMGPPVYEYNGGVYQ